MIAALAHKGDGFSVRSNRNSITSTQNHFHAMRKAAFSVSGKGAPVLACRKWLTSNSRIKTGRAWA